uniref:General secretion pathway protein D n=1 Tax=Candidatus Kentrum sp. TC TaxID=2126339 RepID=A0A450YIU8_9GAMM|nr:MAG: general secretion pathway protein D [Candidatus Kentron sp. TC]VFK42636.1 MAG: general secretion pathway protein D [Candidatus Kentron sp. TC]VFK57025.1 MAG: general secretion pathway protein D [Candidatus Kentron sp. TC]
MKPLSLLGVLRHGETDDRSRIAMRPPTVSFPLLWIGYVARLSVRRGTLRASILSLLACALFGWLPAASAEPITMNFQEADIGNIIVMVSKATGKNFLVDPRVKGKVSVISSRPMEGEELYQVFLSILEVHGFTAVPSGKVIKIIPNTIAKQTAIPTDPIPPASGPGDEFVTRIVSLEHIAAAQVAPLLTPLIHQAGHVAPIPSSNLLILSDRATNVARLVRIIRRIDQASDEGIQIVRLEHAMARDMVQVLNSLRQGKSGGSPEARDNITLIADDRTNSILIGGEKSARLRLRAIIAHLDTPLENVGNTHVIYLRYAKAKDLVSVLTGVVRESGRGGAGGAENASAMRSVFNIQADESTNALVITAPPEEMRVIRAVIDKLDIRRAQVLVEAIIAEVSNDLSAELGIRWRTSRPSGGVFVQTSFSGLDSVGAGLDIGLQRGGDLRVLLRALSDDTRSNVLSTPSLVTMDNEEAEIVVAQNVPFITGEYATNSSDTDSSGVANPFRTIKREDVGLTLKIKPQINEGDTIKLEVEQETSDVVPSPEGASDLTTRKRSIKTSVMVEDGQLIVLGGLIDDTVTETQAKVPLLGDLPLLGAIFRTTRTEKQKRNLMVFLHPRILRDTGTANIASYRKYNTVRAMQMDLRKRGISLIPNANAPALSPIEDYLDDSSLLSNRAAPFRRDTRPLRGDMDVESADLD